MELLVRGTHSRQRLQKLISECKSKDIEIVYLQSNNWTYSERHSVVAICKPIKFIKESDFSLVDGTNIIVCLNLKDPNNIGAIARSAAAFDFLTIAIPKKRSSPISPAVISSSVGAIENLNVLIFNSVFSLVKKMKTFNYWTFGIEKSRDDSVDIPSIDSSRIAIFLGNEESGLSEELIKKLDGVYSIPTSDRVESLNVSVAAGIVMEKIYNKTINK